MTTLAAGTVFAGYRIVRVLGAGGMGTVYLAHDDDLGRPVALKLLNSAFSGDAEIRRRFLNEARTNARLTHRNIVSVYAQGETDGVLWMAMASVAGGDAASLIRGGRRVDPARAVSIVGDIAEALDYAHANGIIHRDVKPSNILLFSDNGGEHAMLADFGIAKTLEAATMRTSVGTMLASLEYGAPEQLAAGVTIDRRADIYALGGTLFHLLTGRLPFPGTNAGQLMHGHFNLEIPKPSAFGRSPALDQVIATAMAKNPADRYPAASMLAAAARTALVQPVHSPAPPPPSYPPTSPTMINQSVFPVPRPANAAGGHPSAPAGPTRPVTVPNPAPQTPAPVSGRTGMNPWVLPLVAIAVIAAVTAGIVIYIVGSNDSGSSTTAGSSQVSVPRSTTQGSRTSPSRTTTPQQTATPSPTSTDGLPAIPTIAELQRNLDVALDPATPASAKVDVVQGADTDPQVVEDLASNFGSARATVRVTSVIPPVQPYGPDGPVLNAAADLAIPGANTNQVLLPFVPDGGEWKLQRDWMCIMDKTFDPKRVPRSCV